MDNELKHLEHLDSDRKEKFGQNLRRLRKKTVTPDNLADVRENMVMPVISQVNDIIENELQKKEKHEAKVEQIKRDLGPQLDRGRENGNEHPECGETGAYGDAKEAGDRIDDWRQYKDEYILVWEQKQFAAFQQLDSERIRNRTREFVIDEVNDRIEKIETEVAEFKQQQRTERQEHRQLVREQLTDRLERQEELVIDVLKQALERVDALGASVDDLRESVTAFTEENIQLPELSNADHSESAIADSNETEGEALYHFDGKSVDEQQEELRRLVETERVDDLSEQEIVDRIDVSHATFFDEEDGILAAIEDTFGDAYPEFRDQDT